jgi:hypothetical protein
LGQAGLEEEVVVAVVAARGGAKPQEYAMIRNPLKRKNSLYRMHPVA